MVMEYNLQFFGGRGSSSGLGKLSGNVVISKRRYTTWNRVLYDWNQRCIVTLG